LLAENSERFETEATEKTYARTRKLASFRERATVVFSNLKGTPFIGPVCHTITLQSHPCRISMGLSFVSPQ
jgi:hypothetical protein